MAGDVERDRQKQGRKINKYNQYDRRRDNYFNEKQRGQRDRRDFKGNPNFKAVQIREKKP